ncbi:unnamed protein product [Hyaloperonospora brassicae]|uniref:RxLR effector candidate protein n=1 Tax=Hyaloperonospora brassicae TaxID=162125 RepID=A0AAV0TSX2_HYABA|nr:unnamed protein product [Hyaloperonospora brassicae]
MALHQSWVMSSRTKTILNAVSPSSSKALATQDAAEMRKTEHQQMESVAVYMYTLVQCYKVDESLRCRASLAEHAQPVSPVSQASSSPSTNAALPTSKACRREITFSPKHARSRTQVE